MLKVTLNRLRNATNKEKEKFERCRKKIEIIVNHPDFKQAFKDEYLEHGFYGETSRKFEEITHLSITELKDAMCKTCLTTNEIKKSELKFEKFWAWFMKGEETLSPTTDNEMDIDLTVYYSRKNVVGYTMRNTLRTWINRKYLSYRNDKVACSNIVHEALHKMGMEHDFNRTSRRKYSVCYTANRCVNKLYSQLFVN